MDGHVGRLHCRYRSMTNLPGDALFASRLDRIAEERLPDALADALDRALGDDAAVYALRSARCELFLSADAIADDTELARAWGERIAAAVVRAIHGASSGSNVVRFADRADQIASFIADLLRGEAWTTWIHHAFDHLRTHDVTAALCSVLVESGRDLSAVLAHLQRRGVLERVLARLDVDQLHLVWRQLTGREPNCFGRELSSTRLLGEQLTERDIGSAASLRPLFAAALRIIDLLDLWNEENQDTERLFRLWLASAPGWPDWRDRTSLTAAVLNAMGFLRRNAAGREVREDQRAVLAGRLTKGFAESGWLDTDSLLTGVIRLLFEPEITIPLPDLPLRPADSGSTPRQKQLVADLRLVVRHQSVPWDAHLDSPGNAVRLLALLVAQFPHWNGDPLAAPFIEKLLHDIARGGAGIFDLPELRADMPPVSALRVTKQLAASAAGDEMPVVRDAAAVYSACAGVFLLVRALLDVRLPALVATAEWPPLPASLLRLGLLWAGEAGIQGGKIDLGLNLLAGTGDLTLQGLSDLWGPTEPDRHTRLRALLQQTWAAQRLFDPSEMHLFRIPFDGAVALVAGVKDEQVWPFSCIIDDETSLEALVGDWKEIWRQSTGTDPLVIEVNEAADCEILRSALGSASSHGIGVVEEDLALALIAIGLVRVWARWLRQFAGSSTPWLLEKFIRRPGTIRVGRDTVLVELEPRPLDIVIEMAGYTSDIHRVPWLADRSIVFRRLAV
jgi:hypothetical protein